jgi:PAS domain S-box-containing protein
MDWAATALGPPDTWPQSLRTAVDICLGGRFPMHIWWGPDLICIYNDAHIPVLGRRHPAALGKPAREVWPDIWPLLEPQVEAVMQRGESTLNHRVKVVMERNGFPEETWFAWSCSPIRDETGRICGLLSMGIEETQEVLAELERRQLDIEIRREQAIETARADEVLRDTATLLRVISDSTGDTIYAKDRQGRIRFANPAALALIGKPPEQVLGKTDAEFLDDKNAGLAVMENDRRIMETGIGEDVEERIPLPDGSPRIWLSRKMPNVDASGKVVGLLGVSRDITESKRASELLGQLLQQFEKQSRLFERIASSTPDFIYVLDLQARFLYANRRLLEVWGKTAEQAIGKSLPELGYPDWHVQMHLRELKQVIDTKQPVKGEVPFTGGSGISGVYEYIFTPVLDPQGNVEVIAGTTRDVSERKRADEERDRNNQALRESEARLRQLADAMPQIVWAARPDGTLDYFNQRWFEYVGRETVAATQASEPKTEVNPPDWSRHIHPEDHPRVAAIWAESVKTGQPYRTEFRMRNSQGNHCWFLVRAEPARDNAGNIVRWFGTCTDITERKTIEEERQRLLEVERTARAQADRSGRIKDEFLATLSHELRTPLNAILGWATILASHTPDAEELRDGLETIQRNARAQTQIIEDLLDMSRIVNGKVRLEVQPAYLSTVLQAAMETVQPAADARGVRMHAVLDPHAGPVSGDPGRLQQIFWNLISNAVKFTPRGGQVQVVLERVNSHLEASIADTGEGISPDFLPHVFDRFRQADASTTRRHGGLGLGLAIVKQLVELHGGTVRVKSPGLGKGSTFTVALPLTVLHPETTQGLEERRHPFGETTANLAVIALDCRQLKGVRVVVVDDEPDARALVKRVLERCGAAVRIAATAEEAIGFIKAEKPDVLVSDIGMPREDGYALIRRVRSLDPSSGGNIPAIALTAYARTEDRIRAVQAGFQTHVVKPVEPVELITMVESLVKRAGTV